MAKQQADSFTLELPGFEKPRGRPRLPKVKPPRQRMREYRERQRQLDLANADRMRDMSDITLARYAVDVQTFTEAERREFWRELGLRNGFLKTA